jgi:hypothetical protein
MSPDTAEPTVLELRIHGMNNTPPHGMLGVAKNEVSRARGDELGGFWLPTKNGVVEDPVRVRREAYSWGGLARTTPGKAGGNAVVRTLNVMGRIGWALLLPFGLANVAYWSRRLPDRDGSRGNGAASARLFGLGLTVLFVMTICEVAIDLIAVQCYANGADVCALLPERVDVLTGTGVATRMLYLSAVPVLALLGLAALSAVSGIRYEAKSHERKSAETVEGRRSERMLGTPDLWQGKQMLTGLVPVHLAAGFAVVVLTSSWPALFGAGTACRAPSDLLTASCWTQVAVAPGGQEWAFGVITGAAVLIAVVAAAAACWRRQDAPDVPTTQAVSRAPWIVLGLSVALLGAHSWALLRYQPDIAESVPGGTAALSLPGINAAPTVVVALLFGLAVSGIGWRLRSHRQVGAIAGVLATVGVLACYLSPWFALVPIAATSALVVFVFLRNADERRWTAWSGMAPGVLLSVALLAAMTLTTMVVLTAGQWLNGDNSAADLVACADAAPGTDPHLCVPPIYVWFAVDFLLVAGVLVLVALLLGGLFLYYSMRRMPLDGNASGSCLRARHVAALLHRLEKVLGILGATGLLLAFVAIIGASALPAGWSALDPVNGDQRWLADLGAVLIAGAGLLLIGMFVGGGRTRPIGLVWDLICFLPRAVHPFGPPCYAERAVPELLDRCNDWLHPMPAGARSGERIVVLSAHSLGAVLAVAVLFAMPANDLHRMRLLTYGTQLRSYFGRIFPELLGPKVLGTTEVRAARLRGVDPWLNSQENARTSTADSLVERLTDSENSIRWRGLWRRTDFIGFPVHSYPYQQNGNPIDVRAEENIPPSTGILRHSDYLDTPAYAAQLAELAR